MLAGVSHTVEGLFDMIRREAAGGMMAWMNAAQGMLVEQWEEAVFHRPYGKGQHFFWCRTTSFHPLVSM